MQKLTILTLIAVLVPSALADTFGTGGNAFTIDFVPISGATNPAGAYGVVSNDYRMGKFEITNDQWTKFESAYGAVTGAPTHAYDSNPYFTGTSVPTNNVSWYEAAQFVNWLNTSSGKSAAYKFSGTQATSDYTFVPWDAADTGYNPNNPFRNSNAFYFLPSENEWVKAAYWNGLALQEYATKAGESLYQGNGSNGGWNYLDYLDDDIGPDGPDEGPWNVGSGSQELNGTYDMMGNVMEWMDRPDTTGIYVSGFGYRGGSYKREARLAASHPIISSAPYSPGTENSHVGFRVASIPEPCTLLLLGVGGIIARRGRRN